MPHAPGISDKVGDLAVEIADLKGQIALLREEIAMEEQKVSAFIGTIENDQTGSASSAVSPGARSQTSSAGGIPRRG